VLTTIDRKAVLVEVMPESDTGLGLFETRCRNVQLNNAFVSRSWRGETQVHFRGVSGMSVVSILCVH